MLDQQQPPDQQDPLLPFTQESHSALKKHDASHEIRGTQRKNKLLSTPLIVALCLAVGFVYGVIWRYPSFSSRLCKDVSIRREWRTLSKVEKKDYIDSVQCLRETPSMLGLNQSLYDDFPWAHRRAGEAGVFLGIFLCFRRNIADSLSS